MFKSSSDENEWRESDNAYVNSAEDLDVHVLVPMNTDRYEYLCYIGVIVVKKTRKRFTQWYIQRWMYVVSHKHWDRERK